MFFFFKKRTPTFPTAPRVKPTVFEQLVGDVIEPLSALEGLHDLMMKTELTKEQTRYVAAMMNSLFKVRQTFQAMEAATSLTEEPKTDGTERLLIIESEPLSARIMKQTCNALGLEYELVASLPMAITALEKAARDAAPFTHILVSEDLPSVSAKESLEYIQVTLAPTTHEPKLILTSRNLKNRDHKMLLEKGYNAVLTKPIQGPSLMTCLGKEVTAVKTG